MKHIYDSALIGNCAFIAHVQKDTNINWLCWPRFDSSFVFGSLLDEQKGGKFKINSELQVVGQEQEYVENTNVVSTTIETGDGVFKVTDFAPRFDQYERYYKPLMLVRKIEPISGSPRISIECSPRGDYGQIVPQRVQGSNHIKFLGLKEEMRLTANVSLTSLMESQYFVLNETKYLCLTYGAPLEAPLKETMDRFLSSTVQYWKNWTKAMALGNFRQSKVIRSALALKLHQYEDTGAVIAASTTSLPESPGSTRNWDYRYCWMRDTYYTLNAFNNIGHFEELESYFQFIVNVPAKEDGRYQPMYKLGGTSDIKEYTLDLEGYLGEQPVRIGNQAHEHIQNDVYGQILVTLLPLYVDSRFSLSEKSDSLTLIYKLLNKIEETIDEPDAGLWEFRDFAQKHCYTFLFHWAGSNAAIKIAEYLDDGIMKAKAEELRKKASEQIEACYDSDRRVFTNAIGSPNLDASTLQLILMGYIDPNSDKAKDHLKALESELMTDGGLFFRYKHADDFGKPETTFLICAFWYIEALTAVGRIPEACEMFDNISSYDNHVGLLSEDVDAETGSQWGNFPQAYSHVGLVNAASRIAKKLDRPNFL